MSSAEVRGGGTGAPSPAHDAARCAGRHGIAVPRGQSPQPGGGRFGRMFGFLPARDPGHEATHALFCVIEELSSSCPVQSTRIPAGYTYLGQFVDHDITFDPTSLLGRDNDPQALVNFRTPRYDLDSLYGSGPKDQPFLYDWDCEPAGVKLLVGHNPRIPGLPDDDERQPASVDLPRNRQGRALVGDARNDENLIVSQLHLLFIHFHNKVVDCLCEREPHLRCTALFEEARRIVRWHYQWVVVHDLLEHLVGDDMAHCVLKPAAAPGQAPTITRGFYRWDDEPIMPVEFSAAAYRCGHSMVRDEYPPKSLAPDGTSRRDQTFPILPPRGGKEGLHFGGFRMLPAALEIDWELFFEVDETQPEMSFKIDHRITKALFSLPPDGKALPLLNLRRGRALGLPAGADVARAMGADPLTAEELQLDHASLSRACAGALLRATPLWWYILCEAKADGTGGLHLGAVGGRIVAEVLVGLLEGDPRSYLRQWPAWRPSEDAKTLGLELTAEQRAEGKEPGIFTMPDLVAFARPARER